MLTYSPATRDEVEHLLLVSEEGKNTRFLKSSHNLWYRFKNYTKAPPLAAREGNDIVALIFATFNKDGYTNLYEIVTMEGHEGKGMAEGLGIFQTTVHRNRATIEDILHTVIVTWHA